MLKIFLDVDGVLADFVKQAATFCDVEPKPFDTFNGLYDAMGLTPGEFWDVCSGEDFWRTIPLLPWARELYDLCGEYGEVFLATSPSLDPRRASGKTLWIKQHSATRKYFITPCKWELRGENRVLIDDYDGNVSKWGENAITFPQPWNAARQHTTDRVGYVRGELARLLAANDSTARV